jgi:RNA polymerase sigma-B factor
MAGDRTPSSRAAEQALLRRFAATRDERLREELVRRYLPLANHVARQYSRSTEPFDDLQQVASIGLLKALDRFDPSRGIAFSSFAVPTIAGELRRHFRDRSWLVRPPRELQEHALAVERATTALSTTHGRPPTVAEIAERCGLDMEQVLEARQALVTRHTSSLSQGITSDEDAGELEQLLGREDEGYAQAEASTVVDGLTRVLDTRERLVIHLRFHEDMTQTEIAGVIGVSQMHVSRILRTCIAKLRAAAEDGVPGGPDAAADAVLA